MLTGLVSVMTLTLEHLSRQLELAPDSKQLIVALSGGVDSVVLLHALYRLQQAGQFPQKLSAIHVNHGLQDDAQDWEMFCKQFCDQRNIPLICRRVTVSAEGSLENAARESRYGAFTELLQDGDLLLLAHHLDDQLETFFLRLQRGAGVSGLSAMPTSRQLGKGMLHRPLLDVSRQAIEAYGQLEGLQWIEDGSNCDTQHDRNFVRLEVLPLIASRWPGYRESWSKSLGLLEEAGGLLKELAASDLYSVADSGKSLNGEALAQLSTARLRNLLRFWLKQLGQEEPGWNPLQAITRDSLTERREGVVLEMPAYTLQLFSGTLHVVSREWEKNLPAEMELVLKADSTVAHGGNGFLHMQATEGEGIGNFSGPLQVRLRQGGEEIRLPGRPTKSLKKLFQESQVPPWLRERTPLLFSEQTLVCVPGLGIAEGFAASPGEKGIQIEWEPPRF